MKRMSIILTICILIISTSCTSRSARQIQELEQQQKRQLDSIAKILPIYKHIHNHYIIDDWACVVSDQTENEYIKYTNGIVRDDDYRLFLQTNAEKMMDSEWLFLRENYSCFNNACVHNYPLRIGCVVSL